MYLKEGTIWKDKHQNLSKVKILKLNDDYYKRVEYEWIYCEQEKLKINKINCLPENTFLNIYEKINGTDDPDKIINVSNENETIVVSSENETIVVSSENETIVVSSENKDSSPNVFGEIIKKNSINHKKITTSSNKTIEIFDDIFTSAERHHHLEFIQNSRYSLGANSGHILWQKNKTFLQSRYDDNDLGKLGIFSSKSFEKVRPYISDQSLIKHSWALASTPFSTYYYHVDTFAPSADGKTLLYYVNDRWDRNWGGETLFADESGESEYAVQYKPGRIVIFDNSIEHRPASISIEADEFRFIFVAQLLSEEFKNNV
jgi:Rps23 Pro-64 3,4-dihydroxylase Tpa1-like proline 4-hydroxylase